MNTRLTEKYIIEKGLENFFPEDLIQKILELYRDGTIEEPEDIQISLYERTPFVQDFDIVLKENYDNPIL